MNLEEIELIDISFDLNLLEKFSSEIKEQIISSRAKGFSKPYRASLINLLARLNDTKKDGRR